MRTTKIFYDFEATSVARDADCVSVGLVAVTEKEKLSSCMYIKNYPLNIKY